MWRSTQQAWRRLARRPAFTSAGILTLALGIGATTATFSLVHGILLRALPVPQPERLVFITRSGDVSIPDGADWRAAAPSLTSLALFLRDWSVDLMGPGEPVRLSGYVVEPEYFRVLGVGPLIGRALEDADNRPGAARVTVISAALWRDSFAADPAILGRVVRLSDHPTTIVGVMPARADILGDRAAFWLPVATETPWALNERGTNNFDAMGRLAPGMTVANAETELRAICERLEREYPLTNRGKIVRPLPLLDFLVGGVRRGLWVLFGGVALVVLIACTNLAGLLLARAATRRREMALRAALGAGRAELAIDMLSEGLLLALAGGALGIALATVGGPLLTRLAPADLPRAANVGIDWVVLAFGSGMALLCGVVCGLAPAWRALRTPPAAALQEGGRGSVTASDRRRTRDLVVAAEVAIAFILLFGAQQLIRSFLNLSAVPLGFDPRGVLTAELVLPEARYSDREAQTRAFRGVIEALGSIPGVEAASSVIGAPLRPSGRGIGAWLEIDGYLPAEGARPSARVRPAMGDYFRTIRAPIRQGRPLAMSDDERAELVVVVNERFVATYWPGQAAVGKRLRFKGWDDERWFTVVGVVADTKTADLSDDDTRAVYLPYAQRGPVAALRHLAAAHFRRPRGSSPRHGAGGVERRPHADAGECRDARHASPAVVSAASLPR
ncbi:MAG: ADOP family duplicated permease [Acidobacteriota bacterium]